MPAPTLPDLGIALKTAARIECRVRPRHACDLEASCQPVAARSDNDLHWSGAIRDISTGGVGVVLKRRFEPGAGLAIELPASGDCPEQTLLARVRHASRLPDGRWLLGCAFISELSDDEVQSLVRLATGPQATTPKAGAGRPAVPAVTDVTFRGLAEDGRPVAILVKRLQPSPSWPLAAGTTLALRVGGANAAQVRLVVQETAQASGGWVVRCRFLGAPRTEVARALGHPRQA
jgi:hypothetical protein